MEKYSSESYDPLLEEQTEAPRRKVADRTTRGHALQNSLSVLILMFLVYNAIVTTVAVLHQPTAESLIYSPANVVLQTEIYDSWDTGNDSKYLQGSQEQTDAEWDDLLEGVNIRVSEEDMFKTQRGFAHIDDAVRTVEGDYVGVLGVYHSLHCLYLLRVAVNMGGYNVSEHDRKTSMSQHHFDHCIDFLRDDVMCHGDMTMYRATWLKSSKEDNNKRIRSASRRQCVNWDPIMAWTRERRLVAGQYKVRPGPYEHLNDA